MASAVGANGHTPGGKGLPNGGTGGKRDMVHIDDIMAFDLDVSPHATIDHLLSYAEERLKSAESLREWGRKDYALRDYLKASTTVVDVVPRNKGWISLISDRQGSHRKYNALLTRLSAISDSFEAIKDVIKADNARTGVQPTVKRPSSSGTSGLRSAQSSLAGTAAPAPPSGSAQGQTVSGAFGTGQNGHVADGLAGSGRASSQPPTPPRTKPAIHPKPQALHGNAIKPGDAGASASSKSGQDLAERFANLRGGRAAAAAEPGARSQPTVPPRPSRPPIALEQPLPDLPKVPDAIYSPARGTVSSHAAQLPSSASRGMFSRTGSAAAFSNNLKSPPSEDYFTGAPSSGRTSTSSRPSIPDGDTVTVQELLKLMQAGSKEVRVLLVDIRSREEFDEGHIMSQSTICIEQDVLQRTHVSAAEIEDSLVLSPGSEAQLFEKRSEFDVVVFYDQDSSSLPSYGFDRTPAQRAVLGLYKALADYDSPLEQSSKPKLLRGGLDAWTNVMGTVSLQTSKTAASNGSQPIKRPVHRSSLSRSTRKFVTRPIQDPAEAKRWEESLQDEKQVLVRTTDDFLRRYPPPSQIQESMTSPISASEDADISTGSLLQDSYASLPAPPTRPAPAVPRPSHSGLMESDEEDHYMRSKMAKVATTGAGARQAVGLINPSNWCYANSLLQCLYASPGFGEELTSGKWAGAYQVPMKAGERISQPQLLSKMLSNLFHWMQNGKFEVMKAKTLMDYCRHIHGNSTKSLDVFGSNNQQDAEEFFRFLLDHIDDETNRHRDQPGEPPQPPYQQGDSLVANALQYWGDLRVTNDSLVSGHWQFLTVNMRICTNCGYQSTSYDGHPLMILHMPDKGNNFNIYDLLSDEFSKEEVLEDIECLEGCNNNRHPRRSSWKLASAPDLLCIGFGRFKADAFGNPAKNNARVTFPVNGLDLTPYTVQATEAGAGAAAGNVDARFRAPFLYDCYGVVVQNGSLKSGHYRAYIKDDGAQDGTHWRQFNDDRITPVRVGSGEKGDHLEQLYYGAQSATAYMLFYQRRKV